MGTEEFEVNAAGWGDGAQVGLEVGGGGVELVEGVGREAVEDEVGVAGLLGELGADALPPVPAAAGRPPATWPASGAG